LGKCRDPGDDPVAASSGPVPGSGNPAVLHWNRSAMRFNRCNLPKIVQETPL